LSLPKGIRANAVLPGAIDTPMLWDNRNIKSRLGNINRNDVGKPEDVAAAIVPGCSLRVDGGRLDRL
jgi:NAD(P)-dependent dehydrogenase (short-subunit alcohol dehydrogenase family)